MPLSFRHIKPLLQTGTNPASRFFSYAGLGIGVLLLLCSIQMYVNIQQLLGREAPRKNGYDFIPIRKRITNETMGQLEKNLFNQNDIGELKSQPFIDDVAPLLANNFRVQLSGGTMIPFVSDFFIESIDNNFIDTVPPSFTWQEGQQDLPLILASDFLELWNVFAPGYEMPQFSKETILRLGLLIICYSPDGNKHIFRGHVVAFSDRINSILVPQNFLDWSNKTFGNANEVRASRLYLKMKDANDPAFLKYLDEKNFELNKDKTKFGRVKMVLQGVFSGLGVFGLMVVILALLLFSFYLQLMIARSKDSLQLLLTLGYSPNWLSKRVTRRYIPVYLLVVVIALVITQVLQYFFHSFLVFNPQLSSLVHWSVVAVGIGLAVLSIITNFRMVRKLLYKLY